MNLLRKKGARKWIIVLLLAIGLGVWGGWAFLLNDKGSEEGSVQTMQTVSLAKGEIVRPLLVSGVVRSQNSRNVYAPSSLKLTEVKVAEGDVVKAGQKLAALASDELVQDIKSAELNLANAKEMRSGTGKDQKNAIAEAEGSLKTAGIEVETARLLYRDTKAQAEQKPGPAVLSALADLETARRQLQLGQQQLDGKSGTAVLSAKQDLDIAQRQYDTLKAKVDQGADQAVVSAQKELDMAQRQYDLLKNQTEGLSGNGILSARKEMEIAQRTYDQLTAQGDSTAAVRAAQKEFAVAERLYSEIQAQPQQTPAVQTAKLELDAASQKYAQLQAGKPLSEQAALSRYNSAVETLNQTQNGSGSRVNQALVDVQNAERDYRSALARYEASRTAENPDGDPALQDRVDQAVSALSEKQAGVSAANQTQAETVKAAQDAVKQANLDYQQSVEGSAESLEQARLAVERARLGYDTAVKGTAEAAINAKDAWEKAGQAYEQALETAREARVNAGDTLEKSKQAYENALGGTQESFTAAGDTLDKAKQAYKAAVGTTKDALIAAQDVRDKAKQTYASVANGAKDTLAAARETLAKSEIGYESSLKNQSDAFASAAAALKRAENGYAAAELNLQIAGSKTDEAAKLGIELQQVALDKLQKQLQDTVIKAPIAGTVTFQHAAVDQFAAGLMFTIEDTSRLQISASIGESDIGSLKAGQQALIKTEGTGEQEFKARVIDVGASAVKNSTEEAPANTTVQFAANLEILEADPRIRIGMNARINIVVDSRKEVFTVPLEAVKTEGGEESVYVAAGDTLQEIPVRTGLQNDILTEIQSPALSPGMAVVADASEAAPPTAVSPGSQGGVMFDD
ncbi:HlyD family efflux transporter periplasmic adaptor subunit [Saccharibacillus qingshengii]|uniref:HlyD family efflux transporter periplasmic adaptor subunit n=1 Tax=Saccharibacillus qingshengii TaxID=1763540 RepID=UPI001556C2F7|nr:HlyD family efflux transporter periplasmic adaptor subunit [Saccharibacillus qingshengii]